MVIISERECSLMEQSRKIDTKILFFLKLHFIFKIDFYFFSILLFSFNLFNQKFKKKSEDIYLKAKIKFLTSLPEKLS